MEDVAFELIPGDSEFDASSSPKPVSKPTSSAAPRSEAPTITTLDRVKDVDRICEFEYSNSMDSKDRLAWINTRIKALTLIATIEDRTGANVDNELKITFVEI